MSTFEHVNDIILFRNLLLLDLQDIWIGAKLTLPIRFMRLKLMLHLLAFNLLILLCRKDLGVLIEYSLALFAFVWVTARQVLFGVLHSIECNDEDIEVLVGLWDDQPTEIGNVENWVRLLFFLIVFFSFSLEEGVVGGFFHRYFINSFIKCYIAD